jgi:hypothetical protein
MLKIYHLTIHKIKGPFTKRTLEQLIYSFLKAALLWSVAGQEGVAGVRTFYTGRQAVTEKYEN